MSNSASNAAAVKRLEALFQDVRLTEAKKARKKSSVASTEPVLYETTIVETSVDRHCDVHGGKDVPRTVVRRGSIGNALSSPRRPSTVGFSLGSRRESMPALHLGGYRRDSMSSLHAPAVRRDSFGLGLPPARSPEPLVHPASFPSMLRRDSFAASTGNLRRDSLSSRRDSIGSGGRKFSTDSLDLRRSSWDFGRRGSSSSSGGWEEPIFEEISNGKVRVKKTRNLTNHITLILCS